VNGQRTLNHRLVVSRGPHTYLEYSHLRLKRSWLAGCSVGKRAAVAPRRFNPLRKATLMTVFLLPVLTVLAFAALPAIGIQLVHFAMSKLRDAEGCAPQSVSAF
jgi:hypothetical protein